MAWGRAKTILILTFLLLNLLLGYQLWIDANITGVYFEKAEIREETHQLLKSRGIQWNREIPGETPELREFTITLAPGASGIRRIELDNPLTRGQIFTSKEVSEEVSSRIPNFSDYEYDPVLSSDAVYVFNQLYEGRPMFEITLKLFSRGSEIFAYEQLHGEIEVGEQTEEHQVLSAYKAVGFLAENVLEAGSVIEEVRLGYHGQVFDSDVRVLAPKWRIATADGEVYYVHAINGEVEQTDPAGQQLQEVKE